MKNKNTYGFTIVEIVVVVAVIAIIAAIGIVGYGSWRSNTAAKQVQSDLNGVKAAMSDARNFNNGFPVAIPTTFKASSGVVLSYKYGDARTYCVEGQSAANASVKYYLSETTQAPQSGSCPGQPPVAPLFSAITVTGTQAVATWNAIAGATGYDIQYRTGAGAWTSTNSVTNTKTITGIPAGYAYEFQVRSTKAAALSSWSASTTRVVVPQPTIVGTSSVGCGNDNGDWSWESGTLTFNKSDRAITSYWRTVGDEAPGPYGNSPNTYASAGASGTATMLYSTTRWVPSSDGFGAVILYGVGPNGELSAPAQRSTALYTAYYC